MIERFQTHLMKSTELFSDKAQKSPIQLKIYPKEYTNDCCSVQPQSQQHATGKNHELATTRFRSNTCYYPTHDTRTEYHESDGQQRTPHRFRKNFDAYELKKGISSILTEKEQIRGSEEYKQSTPSHLHCSHQYHAPLLKTCEHYTRKP